MPRAAPARPSRLAAPSHACVGLARPTAASYATDLASVTAEHLRPRHRYRWTRRDADVPESPSTRPGVACTGSPTQRRRHLLLDASLTTAGVARRGPAYLAGPGYGLCPISGICAR